MATRIMHLRTAGRWGHCCATQGWCRLTSALSNVHSSSICWHDMCNAEIGGEHMSYKSTISTNGSQFERQQEKLRIAREALARVEAKYARKRPGKHQVEELTKTGARRTRAES